MNIGIQLLPIPKSIFVEKVNFNYIKSIYPSIHLPIHPSIHPSSQPNKYLLSTYCVPGNTLDTEGPNFPLYHTTSQHLFESKILGLLPLIVTCSASTPFSFTDLLEGTCVNIPITQNGRQALSRDG